ncbi:MAG: hypothetical protein AB1297_01635 [bacterium]
MTRVLEKAFEMASILPQSEQEKLGFRWIAEIESEQRWEELFKNSQDVLDKLADEALEDLEKGRTEQIGWNEL